MKMYLVSLVFQVIEKLKIDAFLMNYLDNVYYDGWLVFLGCHNWCK